jgi:fatty-acyl-CoA synthase
VLARSNHVLEGYWEQPEASADRLVDGWFHTGDGGVIDDEGYLTISDRKKDVIITGGENVSSIEVEDALFSHPASPRSPSSAFRTRSGARRSRRSS